MTRKYSPPSAHDVARLAGVSQAAVSRAFTTGASISAATRAKVLKAAEELGYRPNLLARSLITGKSGIVGVVIGNPGNPFILDALDALSARLAQAGLHQLVFTARADTQADSLVESLLRFRVDSLLLMSADLSPALVEQCRAAGIPVIYFNRRAPEATGFASVTGANFKGAVCVAEHLIAQGYRKLAIMTGSAHSSTSREREEGFVSAVLAKGLLMPAKVIGGYDRPRAVSAARELLARDERPDAIFCTNDMMALATIETARHEFGLEIGRELGVAGFDNIEGASWLSYQLTTYSQPIPAMIDKVAQLILSPADQSGLPDIIVEGELKIRASTRRS